MFLPLNETEFNGEKSFLNGLLDVLDFSVRLPQEIFRVLRTKDLKISQSYFSNHHSIIMKIRFQAKKIFGLDFMFQVRS